MRKESLQIGAMPAVIYGDSFRKVYLFIHGQSGHKEEADSFAEIVSEKGWQVLSIDLPEHGERKKKINKFYPWIVVPELHGLWSYAESRWDSIALRANSIGAWFSMLAFSDKAVERSLFVSPIVNMENLIKNMMLWAKVSEAQLEQEKTIATSFGQTLSWEYLMYVRQHPILKWNSQTSVLYGSEDNMTEPKVIEEFVKRFNCRLTVMQGGEHWFHTKEQLPVAKF